MTVAEALSKSACQLVNLAFWVCQCSMRKDLSTRYQSSYFASWVLVVSGKREKICHCQSNVADPAVEPIINLSFMDDHCWSTRITDLQKIEDGKQQFKLHNTSVWLHKRALHLFMNESYCNVPKNVTYVEVISVWKHAENSSNTQRSMKLQRNLHNNN